MPEKFSFKVEKTGYKDDLKLLIQGPPPPPSKKKKKKSE